MKPPAIRSRAVETPTAVEMIVNQNPMVMRLKQQVDDLDVQIRSLQNQGEQSRQYKQLVGLRDAYQDKLDQTRAEERANQTVLYMDQMNARATATSGEVDGIKKQNREDSGRHLRHDHDAGRTI